MRDSSRSRDNSKTRIDNNDSTAVPVTIECLDKNSKNKMKIIEKEENLPIKQSSADIITTAEASKEIVQQNTVS